MTEKSFANGNGGLSGLGAVMRPGSPVPKYMQAAPYLDAKAVTTTFWDFA